MNTLQRVQRSRMKSLHRPKHSLVIGAAGIVALAGMAGCGSSTPAAVKSGATGSSSSSSSSNQGTITIGSLLAPSNLDPQAGNSGADYQWLWFLYGQYGQLIYFNPKNGQLEPGAAESWNWVGSNKLQLNLTIRPGLKFQDGTPINAAAVAYDLNRYMTEGDVINNLAYMTTADAIGPMTVAIHLSQPNAQIPAGLADRAGMLVSPTAIEADKKSGKAFATDPVGAGPYSFVSEIPNEKYVFERYNGYYGNSSLPRVQRVIVDIFKTQTAMVTAMRTGDIQVATNISPNSVQPLKSDSQVTVTSGVSLLEDIIQLDGAVKPMNNQKVRLAFSLALNRQAIMDAVTNGTGSVVEELAPPGTVGYVKSEMPLWTQNDAEAKQLLAQAGYPNGVSFSCYDYPGLGWSTANPIVESEEAQVGIHIQITTGTVAQVGPFYKGQEGPCYVSGFLLTANPVQVTEALLWSKSYYDPQGANFGVDPYINKFFTSYTTAQEHSVFAQIDQVEKTNPGTIPVFSQPYINAYDNSIKGWTVSPVDIDQWFGLYYSKG